MTYKSRANCGVIPVTMILAQSSCVMVWCAAWYVLMCRPGIIPCAVTCTSRYFALVVVCILSLLPLILIDLQSPCQVEEYCGKYNVSGRENSHGGKARVCARAFPPSLE